MIDHDEGAYTSAGRKPKNGKDCECSKSLGGWGQCEMWRCRDMASDDLAWQREHYPDEHW